MIQFPKFHFAGWIKQGNCYGIDLEESEKVFFSKGPTPIRYARDNYCGDCPVKANCLEMALENELVGLWGGEKISNATMTRFKREYYEHGYSAADLLASRSYNKLNDEQWVIKNSVVHRSVFTSSVLLTSSRAHEFQDFISNYNVKSTMSVHDFKEVSENEYSATIQLGPVWRVSPNEYKRRVRKAVKLFDEDSDLVFLSTHVDRRDSKVVLHRERKHP